MPPLDSINTPGAGINGVVDINSLGKLKTIDGKQARAEAVASQLESVFWGMMIKSMRDTVPQGGLLGKGLGGENYVQMLDEQLSQMQGMPRDPRFHAALVNQIMEHPDVTSKAMTQMQSGGAAATAAVSGAVNPANISSLSNPEPETKAAS